MISPRRVLTRAEPQAAAARLKLLAALGGDVVRRQPETLAGMFLLHRFVNELVAAAEANKFGPRE